LKSDLLEFMLNATNGESFDVQWKNQHTCCVVMASGGYPLNYDKGFEIRGLDKVDIPLFIAGAQKSQDSVVTSGGRVLNVVGIGNTLDDAIAIAYENIAKIHFDYAYFREDIGKV